MRTPRFYQEINADVGQVQNLSAINHRHAVQVLRLKPEDLLVLFDGNRGEYQATMHECGKSKSSVILNSFDDIERESPLSSSLVLAAIKPDKMDFAIQKAVELGISRIQPMLTQRSVIKIKADRMQKKIEHWQAVMVGACEQSGRTRLVNIEVPLTLDKCLDKYRDEFCIAMLPNAEQKLNELTLAHDNQGIALFIGPEGGFTPEEEDLMQSKAINHVNFGSRILRAETAVVAGLSACQQQWGDL